MAGLMRKTLWGQPVEQSSSVYYVVPRIGYYGPLLRTWKSFGANLVFTGEKYCVFPLLLHYSYKSNKEPKSVISKLHAWYYPRHSKLMKHDEHAVAQTP